MIQPVRLQLSRRKGFDLQALSHATNGLPAINCARPGKWGNPFRVGAPGFEFDWRAVNAFEKLATGQGYPRLREDLPPNWKNPYIGRAWIEELRGSNLACFCAPGACCHVDVLLRLANGPATVI